MKKTIPILFCLLQSLIIQIQAQSKSVTVPSDADNLAKLGAFVGEWISYDTGEKSTRGRDTVISRCQWSPTGKYVLCDQTLKSSNGTIATDLAIFSYDVVRKEYKFYIVGVSGEQPFSLPLDINENRWTYSSEHNDKGKTIKNRTINIFNALGNEIKYFVQISKDDGKTWHTTSEGIEIKIDKKQR